jgi:hypothetical protein
MEDISARMGFTVQGTEATPIWDTLALKDIYRKKFIVVYPQAIPPGGDAYQRTVCRTAAGCKKL